VPEAILFKTMTKLNGKLLISKLTQPFVFIAIGAFSRILPHPANFAPIAAMALFGGAYLNKKQALILPIGAMIASDLIIGFDSLPMRIAVYGSFLIMVLIGRQLKNNKDFKNVFLATTASSILFFLITNFAVWAFGSMYAKTPLGLAECFTLAIPFFRNTVLGDFFYTGVFFGSYELVKKFILSPAIRPSCKL